MFEEQMGTAISAAKENSSAESLVGGKALALNLFRIAMSRAPVSHSGDGTSSFYEC